jgi:hypothetical protein
MDTDANWRVNFTKMTLPCGPKGLGGSSAHIRHPFISMSYDVLRVAMAHHRLAPASATQKDALSKGRCKAREYEREAGLVCILAKA